MRFIIDGSFLAQPFTGMQRFAFEITTELDKLAVAGDFAIVVPENQKTAIELANIEIIHKGKYRQAIWEEMELAPFIKKNHASGIFLTSCLPFMLHDGFVVIHDISPKVNRFIGSTLRGKIGRIYHVMNYRHAVRSKAKVLSITDFAADEIRKEYGRRVEITGIIPNAWQHIERIEEDDRVFEKYGYLKSGDYYFSMGSLAPNKNLQWIIETARFNPDETFVISGKSLSSASVLQGCVVPDNVRFIGYAPDSETKALMHHCKAFILPSFYEGFGLTPLEAVASGARCIILSDIPSLREVYGEYGIYIDPLKPGVLPKISEDGFSFDGLLRKYSWAESAKKLFDIVMNSVRM